MEEKQSTTYHCGYCKEYYLRRIAATKHEEHCRNNPKNKHKCFQGCDFLKLVKIPLYGYEGNEVGSFNSFVCTAQNDKPLYSYKIERKERIAEMLEDMQNEDKEGREPERMPLTCDLYRYNPGF